MNLRPCTVKRAQKWVFEHHRRLKRIQGGMWAISVRENDQMIGVAIVGNPARKLAEQGALCVLRVAVIEGNKNACSMLYGACARAARAMGATSLVTYTHTDEPGTSLKAAGWIRDGLTDGGHWGRKSRPRQPALFPEPKQRWYAPWSQKLTDNPPPTREKKNET